MEKLLMLGDGSLVKGILVFPFAISGLILFFKGAFSNIDEIGQKFTFRKDWQASLFFLIIILSYMAFVYAITKML